MFEETPESIARHYSAMLDSVKLIEKVITGRAMQYDSANEKWDCVDRNVDHLELMLRKDYWTDEDMTPVNDAIAAGKAYLTAK